VFAFSAPTRRPIGGGPGGHTPLRPDRPSEPSLRKATCIAAMRGATDGTTRCTTFRRMPRYFFHIRRGRAVSIDKVGVELTNLAEAIEEAGKRGLQIAAREALSAVAPEPGMIIIDEDWRTVLELPLE
jgi:hypothetical protein